MNQRHIAPDRHRWPTLLAALLLLPALLAPGVVIAAEAVGRVIMASGEVSALRTGESARSLNRGDPVYEGDQIRTGAAGNAQIRFSDGGLFDLEADTRFAVEEYRSGGAGGSAGSAIMSFLRGALRTITGTIGGAEDDTYTMRTPTATIGVRGTGYSLAMCNAACVQSLGADPGLYGRVDEQAVRVTTPQRSVAFAAGDFFFVPEGGAPRAILQPPPGILGGAGADDGEAVAVADDSDLGLDDRTDDSAVRLRDTFVGTSETSVFEAADLALENEIADAGENGGTPEPPPSGPTGLVGATAAAAWQVTGAGLVTQNDAATFEQQGGAFVTDANGDLTSAAMPFSGVTVTANSSTTDLQPPGGGSVADLGVDWGRWNGTLELDDGQTLSNSDPNANLAFTVTDNLTPVAAFGSLSGAFDYNRVDGPAAFDAGGDLWTVDALSLNVDFKQMVVGLNRFDLTEVRTSTALNFVTADVSSAVFDAATNDVTLSALKSDGTGAAGIFGKFVGAAAEGMVVSFFVNRTVQGVPADKISGTQVLRK